MSISNDIVTRGVDNTPIKKVATKTKSWLESINPFSSNVASDAKKQVSRVASASEKGASAVGEDVKSTGNDAVSVGKRFLDAIETPGPSNGQNSIGTEVQRASTKTANTAKSLGSRLEKAIDTPVNQETDSDDNDDSSSSWFSLNYKTGFIIVIILLFLGFNVLKFAGLSLEFGKNAISALFGPLLANTAALVGMSTSDTVKRTSEMSATGTKEAADLANDLVQDTVDEIDDLTGLSAQQKQKDLSGKKTPSKQEKPPSKKKSKKQTALEQAFEQAKEKSISKSKKGEVRSDDSGSIMQKSKGGNKSGWCFIGEDQGFRSCMTVTESEKCMSGEIFSSKEICENPSLR